MLLVCPDLTQEVNKHLHECKYASIVLVTGVSMNMPEVRFAIICTKIVLMG